MGHHGDALGPASPNEKSRGIKSNVMCFILSFNPDPHGNFNGYYKNGIALMRHANEVDSQHTNLNGDGRKTKNYTKLLCCFTVKNRRPCGDVIDQSKYPTPGNDVDTEI